jgi:hypothetical protein
MDGRDHAVTDEEFAKHRPEPEGVCGDVVPLAPLTCPNGPCCLRCVAFLRARATLRNFEQREPHRHRKPGLVARLPHLAPETPVIPSVRVGGQEHRSQTPVAAWWPSTAAGPIPTPDTEPMRGASVSGVASLSAAVSTDSGDRLAALPDTAPYGHGAHGAHGQGGHHTPVGAVGSPTVAPTGSTAVPR